MNIRRIVLSTALGAILATGLLAVFSISRNSAMASTDVQKVINQSAPGKAVRTQDALSTAYVVVVFPGEEAAVRSITWTGTISRVTALGLAGFDVGNSGDSICSIEGYGCPISECFCPDNWWSQGQWNGDTEVWDTLLWPPPDLVEGDIVGFRYSTTSWGPPALPAPSYAGALDGLEWLRPRQDADTGAYGGVAGTVGTMLAVEANEWDAGQWRRKAASPSLLHHLYGSGSSHIIDAGRAGKMAASLAAAGGCWPVRTMKPTDYYSPTTGQYAPQAINQAWAILGVKAMSQTVPAAASEALKDMMTDNGGWGWPGFGEDTDTTAMAIQAIIAAGEPVTSTHVVSGLNYLKAHQNSDGGFNAGWTTDTSNASTARAIQAILAVGQDPLTGTWVISSSNPISYLVHAQQEDGSFLYGGTPNELETRQSVIGMLGRRFPLEIAEVPTCYGISGRVGVRFSGNPLPAVTVTAEGWNDSGIRSASDASGCYTISVPDAGNYTLAPFLEGFTFTPGTQTVAVSGTPGHTTYVPDFVGETRTYLPLVIRN